MGEASEWGSRPLRFTDQPQRVTEHSFCPHFRRGSVRVQRRCCRCKLVGLERCTAIDRQACSLRQQENSEGVRKASDFGSRQEHSLAGGWVFVQSRSFVFSVFFIPFFEVWSEQTTCSFHNDGRRSFSVRSRHRAWTICSFKFSAFLLYWIALLILGITRLVLVKKAKFNFKQVCSRRLQQKPGDAVAFSKRAPLAESPECHRSG